MKFGVDIHRSHLHQLSSQPRVDAWSIRPLNRLLPTSRKSPQSIKTCPVSRKFSILDWHDVFFYGQDEWRVRPNFTLTYGLRYELPGQPIQDLVDFNVPVVQAAGGDPRYIVAPIPSRDKKNLEPRLGFNWNPHTGTEGMLGRFTGGDKLVLRGGYSRTHDYTFTNIALNIWSSFPFVAAATFPTASITLPGETAAAAGTQNAFTSLPNPSIDPRTFARTIVADNFRSPYYDSFSLEVQRELSRDVVLRVGYVGSKGTGLFETIDGNPRRLDAVGCVASVTDSCRVNPTIATIRLRANAASSIYHSMQVSMEKRLSLGFSAGLHYTWSSFIDEASEIFNPSPGEVAIVQDSFNRGADRARSTFDRPHRLAGNVVYELPWYRDQKGLTGRVLGGWQLNSAFSFQSGAPFTPLNGSDPTGALSGIDTLVGNAIRPNLLSTLPVSGMSVEQLFAQRGAISANGNALFQTLRTGQRIGVLVEICCVPMGSTISTSAFRKIRRLGESETTAELTFYDFTNTRDFGIELNSYERWFP